MGGEFQVNTGDGILDLDVNSVAMDDDGDFVVVWNVYVDDFGWEVFARRYNNLGNVQGGEILVNTANVEQQFNPTVAVDADGDFVVTWSNVATLFGSDSQDIYARRFDAAGNPRGSQFKVNTSSGTHEWPWVAVDADGDFVVVWFGDSSGPGDVFARRYDSAGNALSDEFVVNTTTDQLHFPKVAMDGDGDSVIVWDNHNANTGDIFAQRFDRVGNKIGGELQINTSTSDYRWDPFVAMDTDGDFVVTWSGTGDQVGQVDDDGVFAQRMTIRPIDGVGLHDPVTSKFFLRNDNTGGAADTYFRFGPIGSGWTPLTGDWNGDGTTTIGLFDSASGRFFLKDANSAGAADTFFRFGPAGAGWTPVVGDWDGNATTTIGLFDPATGKFFLKDANSAGAADTVFQFGPAGSRWTPVVGDWDGNATTTIGLFDPVASRFFLKDTNSAGIADTLFRFGPAGAGWEPLAGDWNSDGSDAVGLYTSSSGTLYLKNDRSAGPADVLFRFGPKGLGWLPLAGDWDNSAAILAAPMPATSDFQIAFPLTGGEVTVAVMAPPTRDPSTEEPSRRILRSPHPSDDAPRILSETIPRDDEGLAIKAPLPSGRDASPSEDPALDEAIFELVGEWSLAGLGDRF